MSIECVGCYKTVRQPDTPWYAGTRFSPLFNHVCGTCVAVIPPASRRPVSAMQDFEITFGPLIAEIGSWRNYQGYNSKRARPLFAVSAKGIFNNIPLAEQFLEELYPYWCLDLYCHNLMGCEDSEKARTNLWIYREPVREWLSHSPPPINDFKEYDEIGIDPGPDALEPVHRTGLIIERRKLTPEEHNEMKELMVKISTWYLQSP